MKNNLFLWGLGAAGLAVSLGLTLPHLSTVEQEVYIDAPPARVYRALADLESWSSWSPWREIDPSLRFATVARHADGRVFGLWFGEAVGRGRIRLLPRPREGSLVVRLLTDRGQDLAIAEWRVRPAPGEGTRVRWRVRPKALYSSLTRTLAVRLRQSEGKLGHGLHLLKAEVETAAKSP